MHLLAPTPSSSRARGMDLEAELVPVLTAGLTAQQAEQGAPCPAGESCRRPGGLGGPWGPCPGGVPAFPWQPPTASPCRRMNLPARLHAHLAIKPIIFF